MAKKKSPRPLRPELEVDRNKQIDTLAGRILLSALPAGWVENTLCNDYAKDHHIEVTAPIGFGSSSEKLTQHTIYVQRKGVERADFRLNNTVVAFPLELRHLINWADKAQLPVDRKSTRLNSS